MDTKTFRKLIYRHFRANPRSFPWRSTTDPYRIMVSEIMLQQTQVERVLPKYEAFIARFPDVSALAQASLSDVLALWQGLGYNRRGMLLKRAAEEIVSRHGGVVPSTPGELGRLPGIGPYTAGAIAAFAFGSPSPIIETNIRSVFIHCFFGDRADVADREILPLVERTMDRGNVREWYNALMDHGAMLKKSLPNPSRRSRHHVRQAPFRGSHREVRGMILRALLESPGLSVGELALKTEKDAGWVRETLGGLVREGLVREEEGVYRAG